MTPSLSIVIPVKDEPRWIGTAVADVVRAQQASPFADAEIVIVDDGSEAATREALAALSAPIPLRVLHQGNQGRFAARRAGLRAAVGELVLLVDSRVSVDRGALAFVAERLPPVGRSAVWNAHVHIELAGNPYARFWNVLTEVAFAHYFARPRTTSFGLAEFDRFPKGTTCFLAPRADLLCAIDSFESHFTDLRNANDDTIVIRALAARAPVNISPGFSCRYRARGDARRFLRHAYHRGTVLVDGHLRRGARFLPAIIVFYPASVAAAAVLARRPRAGLRALSAAPAVAAAAGAALRRSPADVLTLAALGPPWVVAYGAGIWRGAGLALVAALGR